jgi:altronate hydrolase
MSNTEQVLRLHPADDVVIAKADLAAGATVSVSSLEIEVRQSVKAGHKIALRAKSAGSPLRRYGQVIGFATTDIAQGDHVHLHNLTQATGAEGYEVGEDSRPVDYHPASEMRYFDGFKRADGRVGTRNYVAILSTVNCSASVTQLVRDRFRDVKDRYHNIDGVIGLTHKSGCGQILGGEDQRLLERVLAGYARHPNVAAYIFIGLGCEVNQAQALVEHHDLKDADGARPTIITIQEAGGVRKAADAAAREVERILPRANEARRSRQPVSELVLATNCGGSDSNSGITANPALGWAVDELVRYGGTGVLSETTEIYGAEHLLIRRAKNEVVAQKLLARIAWWQRHLAARGGDMRNNPAPGNKAGGITTISEKSLGGIAKGGTTPLMDVFDYGDPISTRGFVFMDTPGYDPVSVTGLVAGGANVICFTTGRGSVLGCKPTPSIKLASNTTLYQHMEDDMDLDCGVVLNGTSIEGMGRRILDEIVAVASGKQSKSELSGVGEEEFAPWLLGPVL